MAPVIPPWHSRTLSAGFGHLHFDLKIGAEQQSEKNLSKTVNKNLIKLCIASPYRHRQGEATSWTAPGWLCDSRCVSIRVCYWEEARAVLAFLFGHISEQSALICGVLPLLALLWSLWVQGCCSRSCWELGAVLIFRSANLSEVPPFAGFAQCCFPDTCPVLTLIWTLSCCTDVAWSTTMTHSDLILLLLGCGQPWFGHLRCSSLPFTPQHFLFSLYRRHLLGIASENA